MSKILKAPFPYFGGKSKVAPVIWKAIGADVDNYVEPFAGSAAVLLSRPSLPLNAVETINDKDGFVSNFWRAVARDPEAVVHHADWIVSEKDLEARHYWLVTEGANTLSKILANPDAYDAKIAGWWLWGVCAWIGTGWCSGKGPWLATDEGWLKHGDAGQGINRKLPHTGDAGRGINRKLPHTGNAGRGTLRTEYIYDIIMALSDRIRDVRIASGEWDRVVGAGLRLGKSVGIFIDPPYAATDRTKTYTHDVSSISNDARDWSIAYAEKEGSRARIVFAGYSGQGDCEVFRDAGWKEFEWKAAGGYGSSGTRGSENAKRERLWMSPGCLDISSESGLIFAAE